MSIRSLTQGYLSKAPLLPAHLPSKSATKAWTKTLWFPAQHPTDCRYCHVYIVTECLVFKDLSWAWPVSNTRMILFNVNHLCAWMHVCRSLIYKLHKICSDACQALSDRGAEVRVGPNELLAPSQEFYEVPEVHPELAPELEWSITRWHLMIAGCSPLSHDCRQK